MSTFLFCILIYVGFFIYVALDGWAQKSHERRMSAYWQERRRQDRAGLTRK